MRFDLEYATLDSRCPSPFAAWIVGILAGMLFFWASAEADAATTPGIGGLLASENLVPWEVQWDAAGAAIDPDARARMLKIHGSRRYAIMYSSTNAGGLETQIAAFKRHGIEVAAVYFWLDGERPGEDAGVQAAFDSLRRFGVRPQIWVSQSTSFLPKTVDEWRQRFIEAGFDCPPGCDIGKVMKSAFSSSSELSELQKEAFFKALHRVYSDEASLPDTLRKHNERLAQESQRIGSLAKLASRYGFSVGLYNHNGWFGLMNNQLAIIEELERSGINNVGIVYTFWHARDDIHDDVKDFRQIWAKIKPHVIMIGISGVRGEMESLYPSEGEDELTMMRVVQESGWQGPVAVLCLDYGLHPETVIRNALRGVNWLTDELNKPGSGGVRPSFRKIDERPLSNAEDFK